MEELQEATVEEPSEEQKAEQPQVEQVEQRGFPVLDLTLLMAEVEEEAPDQELPPLLPCPTVAAFAESGPSDAAMALDQMQALAQPGLICVPAIWRALSGDGESAGQSAPPWFPGSRKQYRQYLRARSGSRVHCALVRALVELLHDDDGDGHDDAGDAEALEDNFAEQVQEHRATRAHISEELQAYLGPKPAIADGDSYSAAMAAFKVQEDGVKLQRDAYKLLHKRKQQDEKDEKQRKQQEENEARQHAMKSLCR